MTDRSRLRLFVLRVLVLSLLVTLFGRLWYLQVMASDTYQQAAAHNQLRDIVTPAPRGQVLDDMGRPLANNRTSLVVSVDRIALDRQPDHGRLVLARLARVLGVSYSQLHARIQLCGPTVPRPCWSGSPYQPIPVTHDADTRVAMQILERHEDFPGVSAEVEPLRQYPRPDGALASHLLGYIGPISDTELKKMSPAQQDLHRRDLVGRDGLERSYDPYLAGKSGVRTVSVDHVGAVTGLVHETPPQPGDDLVTSLDAKVQRVLEDALRHAMANARSQGLPGDSAAGVVLDAQTGHVVAMSSLPTYAPGAIANISQKDYQALNDPRHGLPILNRAVLGQYAPGSTFKLVSTTGLLHDGTASLDGYYSCPSSYTIGGRTFNNFEGEYGGTLNLHQTIVMSCDTVFYQLAYHDWLDDEARIKAHRQPKEGVQKMARAFGLGSDTGVDLPAEAPGFIEDRATKKKLWETFYQPNYCAGAKRKDLPPQRRAEDNAYCHDPGGSVWLPGDQANFDIGQGTVLVTPLQLAVAYAALVNGGIVYEPRIGKAVISPSGTLVKKINAPVKGRLPVSQTVLSYIQQAMYGVTHEQRGTAHWSFNGFPFGQVEVGGKTGTAQVNGKKDTAWFASFAGLPGHKPQYVSVIMVTQGGQGGLTAAPATRELWEGVFGLGAHAGHPALRGGLPPKGLPKIAPDGTVLPTADDVHPATHAPGPGSVLAGPPALPADVRSLRPKGG